MKTYVSYCKENDEYEIDDYYGGYVIDIPVLKKLLKLVEKTHPELLENTK
jgi:hypothetical protein